MKRCKKVVFYSYINSGNRGCEAILRSTCDILNTSENRCYIFSDDFEKDEKLGIGNYGQLIKIPYIYVGKFKPISSVFPRILRQFKIDKNALWKYKYKKSSKLIDEETLALSTGGDIYCYGDSDWLTYLNRISKGNGAKTVLWGCSIEEKLLTPEVIEDLKAYSLITVRESISEATLHKHGIIDNVKRFPDPAFKLKQEKCDIFEWNKIGKIVGINLSTHVVKSQKLYNTFKRFIKYLADETEYSVVLIPHVFWDDENDLALLKRIYTELNDNTKLYLVDKEYNCSQLKYIISHCDLYIGARTHSVIAAYSTGVPALALSYSIKSKGIARDILGTEEGALLEMSEDGTYEEIRDTFTTFAEQSNEIRQKLCEVMPEYITRIDKEKECIEALF